LRFRHECMKAKETGGGGRDRLPLCAWPAARRWRKSVAGDGRQRIVKTLRTRHGRARPAACAMSWAIGRKFAKKIVPGHGRRHSGTGISGVLRPLFARAKCKRSSTANWMVAAGMTAHRSSQARRDHYTAGDLGTYGLGPRHSPFGARPKTRGFLLLGRVETKRFSAETLGPLHTGTTFVHNVRTKSSAERVRFRQALGHGHRDQ